MLSLVRNIQIFWLALVLPILLASAAFAKPISEADIKAARRIAIFMGTFDPVNLGHIGAAQAVLAENGADLVVFLPAPAPMRKTPLSLATRLQLIDAALGGKQQMLYPSGAYSSSSEWVKKIRSWNPTAALTALVGDDKAPDPLRVLQLTKIIRPKKWFVSIRSGRPSPGLSRFLPVKDVVFLKTAPAGFSSSEVRKILDANPDLYFDASSAEAIQASRSLDRLLPRAEKNEIIHRGLYLGKSPSTGGTFLKKLTRAFWVKHFRKPLRASGISLLYKTIKTHRSASHRPTSFEVGGRVYPVQRLLGSGAHGSVYQVTIDGTPFALKVPHDSVEERDLLLRSCAVQRWVEAHPGISVPRLVLFDPEGAWSLSELVDGTPLRNYLGGSKRPSASLERSLRELVSYSADLSRTSEIHLDLVADNILVKNNRAYLTDFGPLAEDIAFHDDYVTMLKQWKKQASGIQLGNLLNCLRDRILEKAGEQ